MNLAIAAVALTGPGAAVAGSCDPAVVRTVETVEKTLPPPQDPAMNRWLMQEFAWIRAACARSNDVEAVWRIENIVSRTAPPRPAAAAPSSASLSHAAEDLKR